uniref:WGS project CBMI000000000 data, contig CS3069_c001552 n=1 Tax=Fusarium clavum TaxID=2594811 RepID=A0A090MBQ6_9HYPO|nr:unnamed protein product [Fusarium clavum]CEG05781.1 unnamed protein product [Fusarium clavum]
MLGPLSPSGQIPGLGDDAGAYFDPNSADFENYFDINQFTDGNDFNFGLETDSNQPNQAPLHSGHVMPHMSHTNAPSPAGTEEILRDDLRLEHTPDRGTKRQRVA